MSVQSGDEDTSQFDSRFTKLTPFDSPVDAKLSESVNLHFKVSTYRVQVLVDYFIKHLQKLGRTTTLIKYFEKTITKP